MGNVAGAPEVLHTIPVLRRRVAGWRLDELSVGVVPTMGALHEGHLALVDRALADCDRCLVTLFVNPIQFGPDEDYESYPRDEERDLELLGRRGCHAVFMPDVTEMFPDNIGDPHAMATLITVRGLSEGLEGRFRRGHFDGVATEVAKLLLVTLGDVAYFGEKDYQQLMVIKRMVRDLDIPVRIQGVPTVREPDGLALSSRNQYLTPAERAVAPRLHELLCQVAREVARAGVETAPAIAAARQGLLAAGFRAVDYVDVVDAETLRPLDRLDGCRARVLGAAHLGRARLIDNVPVADQGGQPNVRST